ncbi:MAG TPA: alpha/beta hydrolase-fold protein, partial [Candidatus Acidoferrum sp.]|nr:alpha/beta hydrolase-fold protein [Candidatus Acidoferrum sp.]
GDPTERPIWVYLPPAYARDRTRRFPTVFVIQGMTGQVDMWANRSAFRKNVPELVDDLFGDEQGTRAGPDDGRTPAPPAIVVFVDCWTSVGGSQFLDSPGTGRYHTYLCDEVVPWVDEHFRTLAEAAHRGIAGKSSGGYGAMVTPMLRPDLFGGLATHAGDALFEVCYQPEFSECARFLRDRYDGSFERFWTDFGSRPPMSRPEDPALVNEWAMASAYSTDDDGTVRMPFDIATGELLPDVWERWLRWDPVRMARTTAGLAALRSQRAIWIDAGTRDEYFLDLGAEAFRRVCVAAGAGSPGGPDLHFELFDAKHGGIEYRYPLALRWLAERLSPDR